MVLYTESFAKKLLELKRKFDQIVGYKINTEKSTVYSSNEQSENKNNLFARASKRILRNNANKRTVFVH